MRPIVLLLLLALPACSTTPTAGGLTDAQVANAAVVCNKTIAAGLTVTTVIVKEAGAAPAVITNGGIVVIAPDCSTQINVQTPTPLPPTTPPAK